MNRKNTAHTPLSLAQQFDAPDDYIGCFGWLLGYSADAAFLDDALERFTRLTHPQRAHQGRIALAVFLDPGNPQISLLDAPGAAHLPIKDSRHKPFRLLHAKVALLGFKHHDDPAKWTLRLLVSTGNWTRQTVEESLDLAWRIDIGDESLSQPDDETRRDCADIRAAWALITWVRELFDSTLLNVSQTGHPNESANAQAKVTEWVSRSEKCARGTPRFFDNRKGSLLAQLPGKIMAHSTSVKRNYLALGSGFYESSENRKEAPEIPLKIIKALRDNGLLTENPGIDLYVNPNACQSVASAIKALQELSITTRPAVAPESIFGKNPKRSLHAKFLFSANSRENSDTCNSAWIYLGSGNLTHPGFATRAGTDSGNLEAGVVFSPPTLYWCADKGSPDRGVITDLLPIQWEYEAGSGTPLLEGAGGEPPDTVYLAPPVACLFWHEAEGRRELRPSIWPCDIQVLNAAGVSCPCSESGFLWRESLPRVVDIRWQTDDGFLTAQIPVIDQYGRIAATELSALKIDEAWWQLAAFPLLAEEDEEPSEVSERDHASYTQTGSAEVAGYPIRRMMHLVESIAAKQIEIAEEDWSLWCNRLEQALGQACQSDDVRYFCTELKINPLSPLRHPSFRPPFAETEDSAPGKLYDETLTRVEICWQVNELDSLGDNQ